MAPKSPTLTVHDTPSKKLLADALKSTEVTDSTGRKIKLTKPGVLDQFRIVKVLGEAASNATYMGMILPLLFVTEIDGEAMMQPRTEREIDALIQRLDEEGVSAVALGVQAHWGTPSAEDANAAMEAAKAEVKK